MNIANKITISRIVLAVIIIIMLLFPFASAGVNFPNIFINELIVVNVKYVIVGVLFLLAVITDYLDGYIARKKNMVTEYGTTMDKIADKILVNSILIILASQGFIHPVIPVIMIVRDNIVSSIKTATLIKGKPLSTSKTGKVKDLLLRIGILLTLFYNLPFELFNLKVSDVFLIVATFLSVLSGFQYYTESKKIIVKK